MSADSRDVSLIQDEDLLRKMVSWYKTLFWKVGGIGKHCYKIVTF